jgi:hypothetical protein
MIARAAALVLALAMGLAAPAQAQETAAPTTQTAERDESREILVMLHMPAAHFRPNARYGGRYDDRPRRPRGAASPPRSRTTTGSS